MGQPWGLSGPQFLGVYAAGIGLTIVIPVTFRQVIRGLPGRRTRRELDPYEVGYLAGGPQRAAEVVIAEGMDCGALRVDSNGQVARTYQTTATGPHAGALDRMTQDGLRAHAVCTMLGSDPSIARIGPDLSAEGLIISRSRIRALRFITAVLIVALLVTGILRLMEGAHNHRPIGNLIVLFILSIFTSLLMLVNVLAKSATPTRKGSAYLRRLRKAQRAGQVLPSNLAFSGAPVSALNAAALGGGAVLLGIALTGFAAVPDEQMRTALLAGMPTPSSGGSSSSGGCGSGGGCGGGGCGGGGCGG